MSGLQIIILSRYTGKIIWFSLDLSTQNQKYLFPIEKSSIYISDVFHLQVVWLVKTLCLCRWRILLGIPFIFVNLLFVHLPSDPDSDLGCVFLNSWTRIKFESDIYRKINIINKDHYSKVLRKRKEYSNLNFLIQKGHISGKYRLFPFCLMILKILRHLRAVLEQNEWALFSHDRSLGIEGHLWTRCDCSQGICKKNISSKATKGGGLNGCATKQ